MSNRPHHLVVGGGIAGLLCALLLSEQWGFDVTIVERESTLGGLLGRLNYAGAGTFDLGMHNMYETGISELDDLLRGLLPENEWQILDGNQRDLAGSWFNGRLQVNSPYPDLRQVTEQRSAKYRDEVFRASKQQGPITEGAITESIRLFGPAVTNDVISPILSAQFRIDPQLLHRSALWLTNIHRILLLEEDDLIKQSDLPGLRERIGYPEQRSLPSSWASGKRAFYPKQYGIHRVIDAIVARLQSSGAKVLTSTHPVELIMGEHGVCGAILHFEDAVTHKVGFDQLYWTASPLALARLIDIDTNSLPLKQHDPTWVVNLLTRASPQMDDLYYFFNYSSEFETFRVTNYAAYCRGAVRNSQYPLAVEIITSDGKTPSEIITQAIDELIGFNVIRGAEEITFAAAERLTTGIPLLTIANLSSMKELSNAVTLRGLSNLTVLGLMSHRDIFFQRDVLADVWRSITKLSSS